MMGAHHAATGAAAWIALTTRFPVPLSALPGWTGLAERELILGAGLLDVGPAGILTGAMVTAGAALLPDADHRHATIARSLPPVSGALCRGLGKVAGGHRKGTHSVLGVLAFTAVAYVAGLWSVHSERWGTVYPAAGLICILLVAFAAKALRFIPDRLQKTPWAVGLAVAAFIVLFSPEQQHWFPLAVGLGAAVHLAGDLVTTGGVNLLWPLRVRPPRKLRRLPLLRLVWRPSGNLAVPVLGNAGSVREWLLLVPVSAYVVLTLTGTVLAGGTAGIQAFFWPDGFQLPGAR
jgi:membrane-bound metal-dependent hydrolase YbcI (DUF457 family)